MHKFHTTRSIFILSLIAFSLLISCSSKEDVNSANDTNNKEVGNTTFEQVPSSESGVDFVNSLNDDPEGNRNVLSFKHYYNGGGVAVGDINNDELPDIFFVSNEGESKLYLNEGDFKFKDISETAGINPPNKTWSTGAVMADVNADGWMDIYICQGGYNILPRDQRANLLLINNGDNTFTERAKEFGIDDKNESVCAAFFDYDKDGDLDLYVLNESKYVHVLHANVIEDLKDPKNLAEASGNLYRNDGANFKKVTKEAGVLNYGFGLGLNVSDINKDGWPDIYVSNDYSVPDFMYINNGDGTFTDQVKTKTKQISYFAMGNDIADFNNDAYPDIAVVDMAAADHIRGKTLMESMDIEGFWYFINKRGYQYAYMFNTLQLNNGNGTFSNIAGMAGMLQTDWSWAVLLADLDNDGWKDSYVTNGFRRYARDNDFRNYMEEIRQMHGGAVPVYMRKDVYEKIPEVKTENLVYRNERDLTFKEVGKDWKLNDASYSNGAAYADLDKDGDLDLIVNNIDHESYIYKNLNRENNGGNYIQFEFIGDSLNPYGYNTKVTIQHDDLKQYQEFHPTRGYASSVDHMVHFGLGNAKTIDHVKVEWPNGKITVLKNIDANQRLKLDIKSAKQEGVEEESPTPMAFKEISPEELGVDFEHKENPFNDFQKEILMPHKQSTLGPKIAVGDVNGDGLDDFYIGGAHGQAGELFLQGEDGTFIKAVDGPWYADWGSEDMEPTFFDADGDGDLDLYVASGGGGEMENDTIFLNDRLYVNVLKETGSFAFAKVRAWDKSLNSNNVVKPADFDGDGDMDLFVGGAAEPGRYPYPERSYLLRNEGNFFKDVTEELAPSLMNPGSVKDAAWIDIDGDQNDELVVVGEWMPVMILKNNGSGNFADISSSWGTNDLKGWWYSVEGSDINNDGKIDLILGNVGKNIKFSASKKKPFNLFANDFDNNGVTDIVLSKEYDGKLVPTRGRECSSDQMPFIKKKFPTYKEFALAELDDILGEEELANSLHLQVNTFESMVLINNGNGFTSKPLPNMAQISPINEILIEDVNQDGHSDLIIAGNMYNSEVETARYDAGNGLVLLGNGQGDYQPLPPHESGFFAPKNVKDLAQLKLANGSKLLIVANNDGAPQFFEYDKPALLGAMHK